MIVMKKIFTILSLVVATASFAQSPVINGIYSPTEGWGPIRGTGTQAGASNGWSGTDAIALYTTNDANYYYFGAQCKAASWMQFMFVVNTKAGGDSTDPWGRVIKYRQTNLPDYIFRGDIAQTNYAQFQGWTGTAWHRWDPATSTYVSSDINANASGTEVKGTFNSNDSGFIEIRVPKAAISGSPSALDVQFIIGGNDGSHGIFDAIPNETNGTSWSSPGNATIATSYITNIAMPASLGFLKGDIKNNVANITWLSTTEVNFSHYDVEASVNTLEWTKVASVTAKGSNSNYSASTAITKNTWYRLKLVDKDGAYTYSNSILLRTSTRKSLELMNNPTKDIIRVSINNEVNTNYVAELFTQDGKRVASQSYQHISGTSIFTIKAPKTAGLYYLRFSNNGLVSDVLKVQVD